MRRDRVRRQFPESAGGPLGVGDTGDVRSDEKKSTVRFSNHLLLANGAGQETAAVDNQVAGAGHEVRRQAPELMVERSGGIGSGGAHEDGETAGKALDMGPVVEGMGAAVTIGQNEAGHTEPGGQGKPPGQVTSGWIALGHHHLPLRGPDGPENA